MSRNRARGTGAETAVVRYLIERGWLHAERRALHGNNDKGDITGIPCVCIEVKARKTIDVAGFVDEANLEAANAHANIGAAWVKRRGTTDPGRWHVLMDGQTFTRLLDEAGY